MRVTVINGTDQKGITDYQKRTLLAALDAASVTEFGLSDMPPFCTGCKACFFESEDLCPHKDFVQPIWESFLASDVLVFAYPVYALRVPASIKSLLDHLAVHWMVHRPDPVMWTKRAVILTNASGPVSRGAQKDVETSLQWLGVSSVDILAFAVMGAMTPETLSRRTTARFERKVERLANSLRAKGSAGMSPGVRAKFWMCRQMHQGILRNETSPGADNRHWLAYGWIK